jgi:hypothetical protein
MYILKLNFLLGFSLLRIKKLYFSLCSLSLSHDTTAPNLSAPSHFCKAPAQSALLSCMDPGGGGYGGFVVVMKLSGFVAGGGDYGRFVVVMGLSGFVAGGGGYGGFVVVRV